MGSSPPISSRVHVAAGVGEVELLALGSQLNIFNARIAELIHLGDHVRTPTSVCGDDDVVIKLLNSQKG